MTIVQEIRSCIESILEQGVANIIICPYGDVGMQTKNILNNVYGINEAYILDNHLCKFNSNIRPISFLDELDHQEYTVILTCLDLKIYDEIEKEVLSYISRENVKCFASVSNAKDAKKGVDLYDLYARNPNRHTKVGKYSSGPLCDNWWVESVGAFCSFASGTAVLMNHPIEYITTHNIIYGGGYRFFGEFNDSDYNKKKWYFGNINPHGNFYKTKRVKIGNDVWLGQNVLITNGSNIGNGVIAGAGAIITKDVPDYAIVVGVPAKIIRYRYSPEQIEELNKIAWWDWTDEEIRERYEDLYLPIDDFLKKYKNR